MPYKPEVDDLLKERDKRVYNTFQKLRENQLKWDDFYELKFDTGIKPPYHEVHLARARNLVDVPVDHLITDNPIVTVEPRNRAKKYREQADLIEKFLQGWANTLLGSIRESAKNLILMGEFFTKITIDTRAMELIKQEPKRSDFKSDDDFDEAYQNWQADNIDYFPLKILTPHPMNCYWHPNEYEGRPWDIYEVYQRDILEVAEAWPESDIDISQAHTGDMAKWTEWWCKEWRCFFVEDTPILKPNIQPNAYGFTPYRHGLSGYGKQGAEFNPAKIVKSILDPLLDEIVEESRIVSMIDSQVKLMSHPMAIKSGSWDASEIVIGPAEIIEIPEGKEYGKDFQIIKGEGPSQTTFQLAGLLGGYLEQNQPGVVRGQAISATAPAYANAVMIGQARLKYGFPLISLQDIFARTLGDGLRLIEKVIKKPLGMYATGGGKGIQTIAPENINGYYRCNIELASKDPTLADNRRMMGLKLWQSGGVSFDEFQQVYLNNPNATEMRINILMDKIMSNPIIEQSLALELLKELGVKIEQKPQGGTTQRPSTEINATTPEMEAQAMMMRGDLPNGQAMPGEAGSFRPQAMSGRMERAGGANPLNSLPELSS